MMSFKIEISDRDRETGRFMSRVHRAIINAIVSAKNNGMKQTEIAEKMGVDKSAITRILSGHGNLTLRTIGDIAFALDLLPELALREPKRNDVHLPGTLFEKQNNVQASKSGNVVHLYGPIGSEVTKSLSRNEMRLSA